MKLCLEVTHEPRKSWWSVQRTFWNRVGLLPDFKILPEYLRAGCRASLSMKPVINYDSIYTSLSRTYIKLHVPCRWDCNSGIYRAGTNRILQSTDTPELERHLDGFRVYLRMGQAEQWFTWKQDKQTKGTFELGTVRTMVQLRKSSPRVHWSRRQTDQEATWLRDRQNNSLFELGTSKPRAHLSKGQTDQKATWVIDQGNTWVRDRQSKGHLSNGQTDQGHNWVMDWQTKGILE